MNLDVAAFYWIQDHLQSQTLNFWVLIFTDKQNYLIPGLATLLAILFLKKRRGLIFIVATLLALGLSDLVAHTLIKPWVGRIRPCQALEFVKSVTHCSGSYSFPSILVSNLFTIVTLWALYFRGTGWILFPIATLAATSRVYLGVHYPSDVLGGMLCGIIIGSIGYKLAQLVPGSSLPEPRLSRMPSPPKNILIIKLSSLGDILHSLPSLRTLKRLYPEARITWLVEEKCKDLLYDNPDIDELLVVRIRHWRKNWGRQSLRELRQCIHKLRTADYDLVLDIQGLLKTGVIARLTGCPARVGFDVADCRERYNAWFTNRKVPYIGKNVHVVDKNLSMIRWLGADTVYREFPLTLPEAAIQKSEEYLKANPELTARPIVAIQHGVGFETKRWKIERFAQLADQITEELNANVLLTWGPDEVDTIQTLSGLMKQPHWVAPKNTMHESMALFRHLKLFIACDTGPLHLAAALGIPTVAIFGSTDPEYSKPHGDMHRVVVKIQPCSFCHKRKCPTNNECMDDVTVDDVYQAARQSLSAPANAPTS